jgi:hypothetical protein
MKNARFFLLAIITLATIATISAARVRRGAGNLFKPGTSTFAVIPGGTTYYVCSTTLPNYLENQFGIPSLYYRSFTIIPNGTCALINSTITVATTAPLGANW